MSVYVVHPIHIDLILSVAIHGPKGSTLTWHGPYVNELLEEEGLTGPIRPKAADQVGCALLRECINSVSFFFDPTTERFSRPNSGPIPELYQWSDFGRLLTPIESCKALACYRRQSSQHPGWRTSWARSFCEELTGLLVVEMAGYAEAEEKWTVEKALARFSSENP